MSTFDGKMIRKKREEKCLSRIELANKASISVRTLEGWENGREPSDLVLLLRIAAVLDCSLQDFCKKGIVLRLKNNVKVID